LPVVTKSSSSSSSSSEVAAFVSPDEEIIAEPEIDMREVMGMFESNKSRTNNNYVTHADCLQFAFSLVFSWFLLSFPCFFFHNPLHIVR
jgi:hypothetical protein